MSTKYKNGLSEFCMEMFGSIASAASAMGVVPQTLYSQIRHPTGGYKVVSLAWDKYMEEKKRADALEESYAGIMKRYNALVAETNAEKDGLKEYFKK